MNYMVLLLSYSWIRKLRLIAVTMLKTTMAVLGEGDRQQYWADAASEPTLKDVARSSCSATRCCLLGFPLPPSAERLCVA